MDCPRPPVEKDRTKSSCRLWAGSRGSGSDEAELSELALSVGYWAFVLLGIAIGVVFRWPELDPPKFLWLDETWRALAARDLGIRELGTVTQLILPSDWLPGKLVVLLGAWPYGLRAVPIVASVFAQGIGVWALRRLGAPWGAILFVWTVSFGPGFIIHSREFKPYALDMACAVATVAVVLQSKEWLVRATFFVVAFISLPSAFFIAGVTAYTLVEGHGLAKVSSRAAIGLLGFLASLSLFLMEQLETRHTHDFWRAQYLAHPDDWTRVFMAAHGEIGTYVMNSALVCGGVFVIGVLGRKRGASLSLIVLVPLALQILASMAQLYPLFRRPSFYWFSLLAWCYAYGADAFMDRFQGTGRYAAILLIIGLAVGGLAITNPLRSSVSIRHPPDEGRAALRILQENRSPGSTLLVNDAARRIREVHLPEFPLEAERPPAAAVLDDRSKELLCRALQPELETRGERMWFFTSHSQNAYRHYEELLGPLGDVSVLVGEARQGLIRFDPRKSPMELECDGRPGVGG